MLHMKMLYELKEYADKQPEATAFISPEKEITYKELWLQSEHLAAVLLQFHLETGSPIMVYGHMEPEMLISFLGCVKSGHPYIPIDTSIPLERIQKIAESSKAQVFINVADQPLEIDDATIQQVTFAELE